MKLNSIESVLLAGSLILSSYGALAATAAEVAKNPDFVDIGQFLNVKVDLRYATTDNFLHENLYGEFQTAFLHKVAAEKFKKALESLQETKQGWSFLVFDALRPRSVQRKLWAKVKGTPQEPYVADPDKGSVHNFGFALDVSLQDEMGKEVDMGTGFDSFQDLAQPRYESKFLKNGRLSQEQFENRKLLRDLMSKAGFTIISNEWWHFDALPISVLKANYKIVE